MANNLSAITATSVKFYSTLTRALAKGEDPVIGSNYTKTIKTISSVSGISKYYSDEDCLNLVTSPNFDGVHEYFYLLSYVEPGSICYVSDSDGNSIFLNGLLFGDGAHASSGGGSVVLDLGDLDVWTEADGTTIHTLDEYFDSDGTILTKSFKVKDSSGITAIEITSAGVKIGSYYAATTNDLTLLSSDISISELNAKDYAKSLLTSVYIFKGSVASIDSLPTNASIGDVYNVGSSLNGMNYAYTENGWDALGGSIDVSSAVQKALEDYWTALLVQDHVAEVKTELEGNMATMQTSIETAQTTADNVSSDLATLSTKVSTNTLNITINTTNITNIASQLTWQ